MKVFQIWYETSVGPTFSTRHKAIDYLNALAAKWGDEPYDENNASGYPDIREIEVDKPQSKHWKR